MTVLTSLIVTPLVGALLVMLLPVRAAHWARYLSLMVTALVLALCLRLLLNFDFSDGQIQFFTSVPWNPLLGTSFSFGVDGIALPMVLLASLLCLITVLVSKSINHHIRGYFAAVLVLEAAMMGVFLARDWTLFYLFWEMTLIPLFFLIDRWGGANRQGAALNFVLYTMGGSVFLLIALLVLFDSLPAHSFAMADMAAEAGTLPITTQVVIFIGLLIGFGVKMPIFPFHGWLPVAHVEAPAPISILLSGILLKMGAFGLIRAVETLPAAALQLQTPLMLLAVIGLIYGGLLAWRQRDLKAMVAYSSVSHMGVVLFGIATFNSTGIHGAVFQMFAHGLVAAALFLLIGALYERTGMRDVNHYSALLGVTPKFAFFTVLAMIAAVGLPGTAGFIAELHVFIGGYQRWGMGAVVLALGVLISATYALRTVGKLFIDPGQASMPHLKDLQRGELFAVSILALGIIILGLYPTPLIELIAPTISRISLLL